jgi:site-specific recombinase XerD
MLNAQPKSPLAPGHADAVARFRYALEERGRSEATIDLYTRTANQFFAFLEERMGLGLPLSEITKEHAREWLRDLRETGKEPAGIRTRYAAARMLFKLALEDGEVTANPFEGIALPPIKLKEMKLLTPAEVQAMVAAAGRDKSGFLWGKRDVAIIVLLYDGGFRASELLGIRESDIDWQRGAVAVMGKGSRPRLVGLGATAIRSLNRYLQARKKYEAGKRWWQLADGEAPVWLSKAGGILEASGLKSLLNRRAREAGLSKPVHPHTFRHSSATALAEDMPEAELRMHFGWTPNSTMVFRYTRSNLADRAVARHRRAAPGDKLRL